jgi:hypothetical protein
MAETRNALTEVAVGATRRRKICHASSSLKPQIRRQEDVADRKLKLRTALLNVPIEQQD